MSKSDQRIKNITIAAIKRHDIFSIVHSFTTLFEEEAKSELPALISLQNEELPIAQVFIDDDNWTLVTTRRIISCFESNIKDVYASSIVRWYWGDFKGLDRGQTTIGQLVLENGDELKVHIETGKASIIPIYAIRVMAALNRK